MYTNPTNIVVAGLGGQGILKATDIIAEAACGMGYDVKKSEVHGMSQRGGSVHSDVRVHPSKVWSPMIPEKQADFLVILQPDQVSVNHHRLKPDGVLITSDRISDQLLPSKKTLNIAMLGLLSTWLDWQEKDWLSAIESNLPEKLWEMNRQAFMLGEQSRTGKE